ncbi:MULTISPECIES: DUF397 domain-containing protein [Thermomonosporaceae]|uniref:DUF397 domain-containing protein n=1 Tax=Thermomonosporaceae TaxID=2012 RepID=UPI00255B338F|nr:MULTISPECIES: DUF397 domain-containing protein [Thermomonosporaceae]MDL4772048.1 DUF397 domain-containing protein [Actinomadura xylanilytica]
MELNNARWRKSSRSGDNGGHCVEVARVSAVVAIRDSKDPGGPALLVSSAGFRRLAEEIRGR